MDENPLSQIRVSVLRLPHKDPQLSAFMKEVISAKEFTGYFTHIYYQVGKKPAKTRYIYDLADRPGINSLKIL